MGDVFICPCYKTGISVLTLQGIILMYCSKLYGRFHNPVKCIVLGSNIQPGRTREVLAGDTWLGEQGEVMLILAWYLACVGCSPHPR